MTIISNHCDVVVCVGPNDSKLIFDFISSVKQHIFGLGNIYVITTHDLVSQIPPQDGVIIIDETIFPFSKQYIYDLFKSTPIAGWYLQQLLKIYAPIIIPEIRDNYMIIDADVRFNNRVDFFEDNKIQFNVGIEHHLPYFEHMKKLDSSLHRCVNYSGICHLMPMKRHILLSLIQVIETKHNDVFWKVFLNMVDPSNYTNSGASEYEILFNYSLLNYPDQVAIRPVKWRNTHKFFPDYDGVYEACHYYNRHC